MLSENSGSESIPPSMDALAVLRIFSMSLPVSTYAMLMMKSNETSCATALVVDSRVCERYGKPFVVGLKVLSAKAPSEHEKMNYVTELE